MTDAADWKIDRLVKARWLTLGLSQPDLADVLDAALTPPPQGACEQDPADADRLAHIAKALDMPLDMPLDPLPGTGVSPEPDDPAQSSAQGSRQSLIELRLLRAFHELRDIRSRRMLVHLAERIVKHQAGRREESG